MKVIEFREISKIFGSRKVLEQVSFAIEEGEVHALLGENGAGKSTLMNILFGLYKPEQGEVWIRGQKVIKSAQAVQSAQSEISMVHQHFMLVENMSILENIILARGRWRHKKWISLAEEKIKLLKELDALDLNLAVNLDEKIRDITVGAQQKVEIIKMLLGSGSILIFDEPTAMLTPKEIVDFESLIKKLKIQGKTIIIITHKLAEIKRMADRCSVIRKGKYIQTVDVASTNENQLAELMVGRAVHLSLDKEPVRSGEIVLELKNIKAQKLGPIHLQARAGEILGIAGVDGNGQASLARVLYGLLPIESGEYFIYKNRFSSQDALTFNSNKTSSADSHFKLNNINPLILREYGVCYIPEDRQQTGLVLPFSIEENLVLHDINKTAFSRGIVLRWDKIREHARTLIAKFDIRPADPGIEVKNLSGGNQQKVILARELNEVPKVVIAYQPTRGLDVGAIEMIHRQLLDLRQQGVAIILISYELDELLSLSDRIAVIFKGKIIARKQGPQFDKEWVGEAMMGINKESGDTADVAGSTM
jgi:simple sugar transport system ATP-binding protein